MFFNKRFSRSCFLTVSEVQPPHLCAKAFSWCALGLCVAVCLALGLTGCSRASQAGRRVVAILPAEYQGSDPAHRWLAVATAAAMAEQVRGATVSSVAMVRDGNEAAGRAATEILRPVIAGDSTRSRLTLYREFPATRKVELLAQFTSLTHDDYLARLQDSLQQVGLAGSRFSTSSGEAFRSFGQALVAASRDDALPLLRQAIQEDGRFTGASLRLASSLARAGDPTAAETELYRLMEQLPADRALERALAQLELASLRADRPAALQALEAVVAAVPNDADARTQLAQALMQARRYQDAATHYAALTQADPSFANHWNQAAYAFAYASNETEALRMLEGYRQAAPEDANADDTAGDVAFFFSRFAQAAASYSSAADRGPQTYVFSRFKAAWALLLAAELKQADETMERYLEAIRPKNEALAEFRRAQWNYLRGRRDEARSAAEAMRRQDNRYGATFSGLVASQLYIWDVAHRGPATIDFQSGAGPRYGLQVHGIIAALSQVSRPGLNPAERAQVVARILPPQQQSTVVAMATHLAALREGRLSSEALAAFQIADASTPESRAQFTHALLGWALTQTGQHEEALKVFDRRVPPLAEDDGLLWPLILPASLQWEQQAARAAGKPSSIDKLDSLVNVLIAGSPQ